MDPSPILGAPLTTILGLAGIGFILLALLGKVWIFDISQNTLRRWAAAGLGSILLLIGILLFYRTSTPPPIPSPDSSIHSPVLATPTPAQPVQVFGPITDRLAHDPKDEHVKRWPSEQNLRDFIAEARFYNPYDASEHSWDYGFIFRSTGPDAQYRVYVKSTKEWFAELFNTVDGQPQWHTIAKGPLGILNVGANQSNDLRLIVKGETAELLVNNSSISTIGVGAKMESGNIAVVTGFNSGDEVDGKITRFEKFIIYKFQ